METQIKNLISIAKEYADFGRLMSLPENHTIIRGKSRFSGSPDWFEEGERIQIYYADRGSICAVYFWNIEIALYKDTIEIPFNVTTEYLQAIIDDVTAYLAHLKETVANRADEEAEKAKQKEIADLKRRLEILTGADKILPTLCEDIKHQSKEKANGL